MNDRRDVISFLIEGRGHAEDISRTVFDTESATLASIFDKDHLPPAFLDLRQIQGLSPVFHRITLFLRDRPPRPLLKKYAKHDPSFAGLCKEIIILRIPFYDKSGHRVADREGLNRKFHGGGKSMGKVAEYVYGATDFKGSNPGYGLPSGGNAVMDIPTLPTHAIAIPHGSSDGRSSLMDS